MAVHSVDSFSTSYSIQDDETSRGSVSTLDRATLMSEETSYAGDKQRSLHDESSIWTEHDSGAMRNAHLARQLAMALSDVANLMQDLTAAKKTQAGLEAKNKQLRSEKKMLLSDIHKVIDEYEDLERKFNAQKKEIEDLKGNLEEITQERNHAIISAANAQRGLPPTTKASIHGNDSERSQGRHPRSMSLGDFPKEGVFKEVGNQPVDKKKRSFSPLIPRRKVEKRDCLEGTQILVGTSSIENLAMHYKEFDVTKKSSFGGDDPAYEYYGVNGENYKSYQENEQGSQRTEQTVGSSTRTNRNPKQSKEKLCVSLPVPFRRPSTSSTGSPLMNFPSETDLASPVVTCKSIPQPLMSPTNRDWVKLTLPVSRTVIPRNVRRSSWGSKVFAKQSSFCNYSDTEN